MTTRHITFMPRRAAPSWHAALLSLAVLLAVLMGALPEAQAAISYRQILADPDNPALNRQYAKEQLAAGNAKAALAALERVLVRQPTNIETRFLRARVLAALGSTLQASNELRALAALPLPPRDKRAITQLREQLRLKLQKRVSHIIVNLGMVGGDNVNNYPDAGQVTFRGNVSAYRTFDMNGQAATQALEDEAFSYQLANINVLKTGYQALDEIHLNLSLAGADKGDTGFLGHHAASAGIGGRLVLGKLFVIPSLRHTQVKNELPALGDLDITLANIAMSRALGKRLMLSGSFAHIMRRYDTTQSDNDTDTQALTVQTRWQISAKTFLTLAANARQQSATRNRDLDKTDMLASLGVSFLPGRAHRLSLTAEVGQSRHDNVYTNSIGPNSTGLKREDDMTEWRAAYRLDGAGLSPLLENLSLTLTHRVSETQSNFVDFDNQRSSSGILLGYQRAF
jgi:hypothetical protein